MSQFQMPLIKLSETMPTNGVRRLQVLRVGKFFNERYGNFEITANMLSEMVSNFKSGVRGVVPALDFSHDSEGVAAGWFKDLLLSENGQELWADIEMTPRGEKSLAEKEFGYLSAEFDSSYQTNEVPVKKVGAVLLGAGLTNRPVIKEMKSAILLSEGEAMTIKELEEKVKELTDANSSYEEKQKMLMEAAGVDDLDKIMEMIKSNGAGTELKVELEEKVKETEKMLSEKTKEVESLKKENSFNIMLAEGKVCNAQRDAFIKGDMIEFAKNAQALNDGTGHGGSGSENDGDANSKIISLAEKKRETNKKLTMAQAISQVRKENPELAKKAQN